MAAVAATTGAGGGAGIGGAVAIGVFLVATLSWRVAKRRNIARGRRRTRLRAEEIRAAAFFPVGTLASGLSGAGRTDAVCAVTDDDLVFMANLMTGRNPGATDGPVLELGRIPRAAIDSVGLTNVMPMQTRAFAGRTSGLDRMSAISAFSPGLARRQRLQGGTVPPNFVLLVQWTDDRGAGQRTVFELVDPREARHAEGAMTAAVEQTAASPAPAPPARCPACGGSLLSPGAVCPVCGARAAG